MEFATEKMAYDLLAEHAIPFERVDHPAIVSVRDTDVILEGQQVKNLFLKNKKGSRYYLVILHDEKQADIKAIADQLGESRLSFASAERVEDMLHVLPGTVTPFSLLFDEAKKIEVVVDVSVDQRLTVGFHPFINSTTLNIPYVDFERLMLALDHPIRVITC